jgi:hypothetical protein
MNRLLLAILISISANANAQQYRKFFFAIDIGSPNSKLKPRGSFTMEPSYRINDKLTVGLRMEQIGFLSGIGGDDVSLGSMGINAHYYFSPQSMRPFCGIGVGLYNPSNNFIMSSTDDRNQRNGFGVYPRAGLEFGHMRLMLEYNFIQKMTDYISFDVPGNGHYETVDKSYLSLKIGLLIGGGKKKAN